MSIDWGKLLTVDGDRVAKEVLSLENVSINAKLHVRGYSLPFDGTQQRYSKFVKLLSDHLIRYVFPESEREDADWPAARDKFGNISPESDGKLGEMLLYVLVEAFLKTPMIAYKLKDMSNPNDQVKGADGVFIGEYNGYTALLIGESKIYKDIDEGVAAALLSLNRFHKNETMLENETLIARKYPSERKLSGEMLDKAISIITGNSNRVLVHPVFIAYDLQSIKSISQTSSSKEEAENALIEKIKEEVESWKSEINKHRINYQKPFSVFLDFFFMPLENTLVFRNLFYQKLHNAPYVSTSDLSKLKKLKTKEAAEKKESKTKITKIGSV